MVFHRQFQKFQRHYSRCSDYHRLVVGFYALLASLKLPNLHAVAQTVLGKPLGLLGNNLFGLMILVALNSSFWFVGLHGGNVVNAVMKPLWLSNLDANKVAYQAGEKLPHIFTSVFMDNFVFIGGGGATIGLVLALGYLAKKKNQVSRSKHWHLLQ